MNNSFPPGAWNRNRAITGTGVPRSNPRSEREVEDGRYTLSAYRS